MKPKRGMYSLIRRLTRSERDPDRAERGEREDQVAEPPAEQSDRREQGDADNARADEAEQEERADRRHDVEVGVVVLLGVDRADDEDRDRAEVAGDLAARRDAAGGLGRESEAPCGAGTGRVSTRASGGVGAV